MADLIPLARLADVRPDRPLAVHVAGVDLVLVQHGDGISLLEGRCPHQGTLLAEGSVDGGALICRGHGWRFDCASGARSGDAGVALQRFDVALADGHIWIDGEQVAAWKHRRDELSRAGHATQAARRTIASLPGPRGLPLIGNAHQLDPTRLHQIFEHWCHSYGPLYTFTLLRRPFVVVADAELIQHILRDRPDTFRRISAIERVPREMGITGVFTAEGAAWRRQRRLVMQALDNRHLQQFFPTLLDVTRRLQRRWAAAAASQRAVDVQQDLMRYTVDVTTNLAFGYDLNTLEQGEHVIQRHLARIFPMLNRRINAPFAYWRYLKLPADRALDRALAALRSTIGDFITHSREQLAQSRGQTGRAANFLEALLLAQQDEQAPLSDDEVFGNVFNILLAGEDTTANTIAWMLHFLSEHPEMKARLQAEVDAVLGDAELLPDMAAADQLVYLEAVAYETMRLKPVVPFLFLETNCEVELGGVVLPQATAIVTLNWHTGLLEQQFAAATEFRPERWLAATDAVARQRAAIVPFGSGPRLCPGRNLALLEIKTAISMICRHFSVSKAAAAAPVGEVFAFTLMPTGVVLRFRPRTQPG